MKIRSYIIIILLMCAYALNAQLISVRSELSKDTIAIGEQAEYTFSMETSGSVEAEFPVFYDTISSSVEILSLLSVDTTFAEDKRITSGKYLVTSFEKGENVIQAKAVKFTSGEISDTAYSLPLLLHVVAPVVDTTLAIKPIKPPVNTPVSFREMLPWIGIGLGGLLIIAVIIYLIRRYTKRKREPELFNLKPKEPAHIIALRNLDKLKKDKIMESSNAKQYYSRLTEIIRIYISDQYGLQAMESTSGEIMEEFKVVNREKRELNDMLEELLQLADLVKFAKEDPLMKEKEMHLNNAYSFVNQTHELLMKLDEEESAAAAENSIDLTEKDNSKK